MSDDLLIFCPKWLQACMKEKCVSYEVHTKQRFKNIKTEKYIPIDQLSFYSGMSQEQINETVERRVSIVRECREFGKIIQIEQTVDHNIPSVEV